MLQILETAITTADAGTDLWGIRDLISLEDMLSAVMQIIENKKILINNINHYNPPINFGAR